MADGRCYIAGVGNNLTSCWLAGWQYSDARPGRTTVGRPPDRPDRLRVRAAANAGVDRVRIGGSDAEHCGSPGVPGATCGCRGAKQLTPDIGERELLPYNGLAAVEAWRGRDSERGCGGRRGQDVRDGWRARGGGDVAPARSEELDKGEGDENHGRDRAATRDSAAHPL